MLKTIFNKILENIGEVLFSIMLIAVGPIVKRCESICIAIVSYFSSHPRATVFGIAVCIVAFAFAVYLLCKRVGLLNRKCKMMVDKIADLENPMRNLILESGTSIFKDTEKERFICPKCFAENRIRSFLERVANDEYSYQAYTYRCHVCGFKTYDITGLDKYAAAEKAKRVESNRESLFSGGAFGCI